MIKLQCTVSMQRRHLGRVKKGGQCMNESRVWVATNGVLTPGGDPLWHCPSCGEGKHLYGIESPEGYSTKCSNCGIPLIYPHQKFNKKHSK